MLSIVVMVSFFVMLTSVDILLEPAWTLISTDIENIYRQLYITVIIMSLTAIIIGISISIFIFNRGINKYKDFLRRFDNIEQHSVIRPSILRFPDQDEFGNLGSLLNNFISKIDYYDQLKTNLAKAEHEKFEHIAQLLTHPLLLISLNSNEPYISFYKQSFRDLFLKKSVFIDIHGKTQTQYYAVEDTPLVYFTLKTDKQEPFLTPQLLKQLKNNEGWKKHSLENLTFSDLSDDKKYNFQRVVCVPITNDLDQSITQMMYIFIDGKEVEKKTSSEEKIIIEEENIISEETEKKSTIDNYDDI